MEDCCPPQRQKSTGVTHQRRCIRRNSRKRRYCHDNCTCTLLVFLVCIEPLYYTVLNVTSYETLYDSIALQTIKQTNPACLCPAWLTLTLLAFAPLGLPSPCRALVPGGPAGLRPSGQRALCPFAPLSLPAPCRPFSACPHPASPLGLEALGKFIPARPTAL